MKLLDVINFTDRKKGELWGLASTVDAETRKINALYDAKVTKIEDKRIESLNNLRSIVKKETDAICESYECDCHHNIVVRTHGSCVTGVKKEMTPNTKHVVYTCALCLKKLKEEEILPSTKVLDYFGHEDALEPGYNDLAIVDYVRSIITDCLSYSEFSDDELESIITEGFNKVPESYVKRS